eukprot:9069708-Prorocentrum_lima.AAC.1
MEWSLVLPSQWVVLTEAWWLLVGSVLLAWKVVQSSGGSLVCLQCSHVVRCFLVMFVSKSWWERCVGGLVG